MKEVKKDKHGYRKRIEQSMEHAEIEQLRKLSRTRVELARQGVALYNQRKIADAVIAFKTYLKVLERIKGVGEGQLTPGNFDKKADISELLLINGVYWDLMKIYDQTTQSKSFTEFQHYTEKFVLFARGMPFQPLASETIRKYISNNKAVHKADFRGAYKLIATSNCFVATHLVDVTSSDTIEIFREFRDEFLSATSGGRKLACWYYRHGGKLALATDRQPEWMRRILGKSLDRFARLVKKCSNAIGSENKLTFRKIHPK